MLGCWDWLCIGGYFVLVFGVAGWATWRHRTRETSAGYFLAGRNVGWFVIGASLFASNIGSEHLVGLAGVGADSGVAMGQFECQASLCILVLGWVFVPFYINSGVFTMPEFLERRYSAGARWYLAVVCIISYVLTKISVTIYAGGIVFTALMGINFWTGALIVVVATGIYTVLGGLRAVLYTDLIQMFVLIGGSIAVTIAGLAHLGGWDEMCRVAGPDFLSMWKPMSDPDFPWTGILFGAPLVGIWYWCTDQFIVQRTLSAKDQHQAQLGTMFAAYLKILPLFIFVIPGVIAYALAKTGKLELAAADQALPTLIKVLLPVGLRGLVVAGLLAALMSSLSSVFNSCSTLITWDVYRKLHPKASEKTLVRVGQVSTAILVGLGLLWIPFMKYISDVLYVYLQNVQAYISPPITAVFLIGIFWKRANARGAMASLVTGFVLGMGRLVAQLCKTTLAGWRDQFADDRVLCSLSDWLYQFAAINFLHFSLLLFLLCAGVLVVVSLTAPAASDEQLAGLTYATAKRGRAAGQPEARSAGRLALLLTGGLLVAVGAVWYYFSPLVFPG